MSVALQDYLQQQPGVTFKKLYQQPATVLAVLRRMLPHLAKNIVMAMLFMHEPFSESDLFMWIREESSGQRDEAISVLERLHILLQVPEPSRGRSYKLHGSFANSLRQALTGHGSAQSFGSPFHDHTGEATHFSIAKLDAWARGQWESILYYMVGSTGSSLDSKLGIAQGTKKLLAMGDFVTLRGDRAMITKDGFTFLLQDANTQVWSLLIVYLNNWDTLQMDPVEMLSFLFMLGTLELGQDYSTAKLTPTQQQMLDDLHDFGIVYRPPNDPRRFYPTRLATTLTSSDSSALLNDGSSSLSAPSKGYILLETNHRVYAYTSSPLQIAVLDLFVKLTYRFPNLVSGKLTKDSVQKAIAHGITSDQIISYLTTNAHPQMQKSTPVLPPTVVDQIRLWQIEGDRMKTTPGFLLKNFSSAQEYDRTANYAESLGVLVWRNDAKQLFFASRVDQLKNFIEHMMQEAQAKKPTIAS